MTNASDMSWADALEARRQTVQAVRAKRSFWQHVWVFATVNGAFWLSWIIGGIRDGWVLPWPAVPTVLWGSYLLYREYQLGGPQAVSHATIDRQIHELRHPAGPVYYDRLARKTPLQFGDITAYTEIPHFHLQDVIDAREAKAKNVAADADPDYASTGADNER